MVYPLAGVYTQLQRGLQKLLSILLSLLDTMRDMRGYIHMAVDSDFASKWTPALLPAFVRKRSTIRHCRLSMM